MKRMLLILTLFISGLTFEKNFANSQIDDQNTFDYSFDLKEVGRMISSSENHNQYLIYKIIPHGFPKNKELILWIDRPNSSTLHRVFIDEDDNLINLDLFGKVLEGKLVRQPFLLIINNPSYGEYIYFSIYDTGKGAEKDIVPFPIQESYLSKKIELKLVSTDDVFNGVPDIGKSYLIRGYGFEPFENIIIDVLIMSELDSKMKRYHALTNHQGIFYSDNLLFEKKSSLKIKVTNSQMDEFILSYHDECPDSEEWYPELFEE